MKTIWPLFLLAILFSCSPNQDVKMLPDLTPYNLEFDYLPMTWDEGLPLGNGQIGALIWQKEDKLRLSLDHVDLWDERKMENLQGKPYKYSWVKEQWEKDTYKNVQDLFDAPYDKAPAPSKIPGGALEFAIASLGKVKKSTLYIATGTGEIQWESGASLRTYVHAANPIGWFKFEGIKEESFSPELMIPAYNLPGESQADNPETGQDLRRLGYPEGLVEDLENGKVYTQKGYGDFEYQITVRWKKTDSGLEGVWAISTNLEGDQNSKELTQEALGKGFLASFPTHSEWWNSYWSKSNISIPDSILQRQWYLEQYKFASTARENTPPISLQAVWTADNGKLPPWKGDFHHDLNTQLSYWPSYTANHLDLSKGFLNWLWKNYPTFKEYTKTYYESDGLNVPGVSTLTGAPMGGWIQYAFGPTVSGWLSHHFYLQWRYSMDREFLENEAYPWFKEVAIYFDDISEKNEQGMRKLPISASPEVHNNSRQAWFGETTNFDLANIRFVYSKAAELARELGNVSEAEKWESILAEWPDFAVGETGLLLAPEQPLENSHRHFSHLMAIHPLSLINWSDGEKAKEIIRKTAQHLKTTGSSAWVGYSFSWQGNVQARMLDGEGAAETLRIFATSFCLPNSFHVNGDQSGKGYSNYKYRPFTLEGNFAFASGVQEMLIQSHEDFIRLFPAVPSAWENVSFDGFLTQGAFQVSATKVNGSQITANISAPNGGKLRILNPIEGTCLVNGESLDAGEVWEEDMNPGESIKLSFVK